MQKKMIHEILNNTVAGHFSVEEAEVLIYELIYNLCLIDHNEQQEKNVLIEQEKRKLIYRMKNRLCQ